MSKGGPREGAGRPPGSRGKRTREAVAKAEALGPTPLEVLLESMHAARAEGERAEAVEYASIAAPYVHPKVTPSPASAPVYDEPDYSVLSDAELEQIEKLLSKVLNTPGGRSSEARTPSSRGFVGRAVFSLSRTMSPSAGISFYRKG